MTETLIDALAATWALRPAARQPPALTSAWPLRAPLTSATALPTFVTAATALVAMPFTTLSRSGRFFSSAAMSFVPALASAPPENVIFTAGGEQVTLASSFASQDALHSALTLGISSLPEHLGSLNLTEHLPEQVPPHLALAASLQEPLHWPLPPPVHLPSHLPAHLPLASLPSHWPSQSPSQVPENEPSQAPLHSPPAETSQEPSHSASQAPDISPPSHLTSAPPPLTDASHEPAHSAAASTETPQTGGAAEIDILPAALASAFAVPRYLTARSQSLPVSLPAALSSSSFAPRSFARPVQAVWTSASRLTARACTLATASRAPLILPSTSAWRPKLSFAIEDGSLKSPLQPAPGRLPQFMRSGDASIATSTGQVTTRLRFELILGPSCRRRTVSISARTVHNGFSFENKV